MDNIFLDTFIEEKISVGTRLGSMLLDHVIMIGIMMLCFMPTFVINFNSNHPYTIFSDGWRLYLFNFGFSLYFCKDLINGRSPAKRILKLQVVSNSSGQPAKPLQCLIRDLFCILWPIEVLVSISNTSRRIGDRVAGTKLVVFNPSLEQEKPNVGQIIFCVLLANSFGLLFTKLLG